MTKSQTPVNEASHTARKVSIQERSVLVGDIIFVNGHRINRVALQKRFAEGGYQLQETPHFMLFTRLEAPTTILVHWFTLEEMNADIKHYIAYELKPLGLITHSSDFGNIFSGVIGSFFPKDAHFAWHEYGAKTLQRFLLFLSTARTPTIFNFYATIGVFSNWYQRVCELCVGESFLDAGCESGFLPLIIAERIPFMKHVVGVDIRPDMFEVMKDLAVERQLKSVHFEQADLLAPDFATLGSFDTVTALGVIEHFTEAEMYRVLTNLLAVTNQRLILTVPYEEEPEIIYEHKQLFTRAKLEVLGAWCLAQWGGVGRQWCEDADGGLLLLERCSSRS
jgi:SAM-dependent methyltransferase